MTAAPEVLGPYVIYERLGAGGMATVHRADHIGVAGFRKPVALKRLLPHVADEPTMLEMFIHEARLASQLRHANVATTYDLGKVDDTYFIAMEYVPGPTLTQIMKQIVTASGPMPVSIVVAILSQLCDALDHAHNLTDDAGTPLGIVHRDVSPSNIIVSTSGLVKLIDFGIAKATTGGVKTQTGMIKGKYAYIAPEYMLGQLDRRADLFGVGIIAHELLTTRRLFSAPSDYDTLKKLRELQIQPPSQFNADVPPDLDDIVLTALQRDPDQRWQSASAMRTALTNVARSMEGGMLTNQQMAEWVAWAFAQKPRKDLAALLGAFEEIDGPSMSGDNDVTTHRLSTMDQLDDYDDELAEPPAPSKPQRARRMSDPPLVIVDGMPMPGDDRPAMPTLAGGPRARKRPSDAKLPRADSELPTPAPTRESRPRLSGLADPSDAAVTMPRLADPMDGMPTAPRLDAMAPIELRTSTGHAPAPQLAVPTSLPLGGPAHLAELAARAPAGAPINRTIVAPSGLAPVVPASGSYLSPAERATVLAGPPLITPRDNDTGELVVVADPVAAKASEPKRPLKEARRWPRILLALTVLLGVAAGIAYFIAGYTVDL